MREGSSRSSSAWNPLTASSKRRSSPESPLPAPAPMLMGPEAEAEEEDKRSAWSN